MKKGLQRLASVQQYDFMHQETAKLAIKNHVTSFVLEDLNREVEPLIDIYLEHLAWTIVSPMQNIMI